MLEEASASAQRLTHRHAELTAGDVRVASTVTEKNLVSVSPGSARHSALPAGLAYGANSETTVSQTTLLEGSVAQG
jgi:hypothetical protein